MWFARGLPSQMRLIVKLVFAQLGVFSDLLAQTFYFFHWVKLTIIHLREFVLIVSDLEILVRRVICHRFTLTAWSRIVNSL
jgi:hypothetical protein